MHRALSLLAILVLLFCPSCTPARAPDSRFFSQDLFVSPAGNDFNPGTASRPLRTIEAARDLLRQGPNHSPTTVYLRTGRYPITQTLQFTAEDSHTTYAAYPAEHPTLSAAIPVTGWTETVIDGKRAWTATIPGTAAVRMLTANGLLLPRPRLPKLPPDGSAAFFRFESAPNVTTRPDGTTIADTFNGADSFIAKPGDVKPFHNLTDVEAVVCHFWIEERMPIESFDPATRRVVSTRKTQMSMADDHTGRWGRYYLDNVREAMTDAGDWYFDRVTRTLTYLPRPHQTLQNTFIERAGIDHLVTVNGASHLTFRNLTFTGSGWHHPSESLEGKDPKSKPPAGMTQTATTLASAIKFTNADHCRIEDSTLVNIGLHAIELAEGCTNNHISGNHIHHTGGGGIRVGGGAHDSPPGKHTHNNQISDNHIHHIGRVFHSAAAILVQHAYATTISHNHVHDGYQMAIPVGWSWGYGPSVARDNRIEYNHIHHFGHGWLSDIGGIYTLGPQPGTVIRNNHVHDIYAATYGGWCIYPDEGSSGILIENNLAHDTSNNAFHQHYGKENIVRNNIFAFGKVATLEITRPEPHQSLTFEKNIIVADANTPLYGPSINQNKPTFTSDHNLLFSPAGPIKPTASQTLKQWQQGGHDQHSIIADPRFKDLSRRDFTLLPGSPALDLGFTPIDLSAVGPRPQDGRK